MPESTEAESAPGGDPPPGARRWTARQRRHIEWLATPKSAREPRTKEDWADKLGVNRRTLTRWEKLPGFMDEVWALAQIHLGARLPQILTALADAAEGKNVPAIRLALEVAGRLTQVPHFNGTLSLDFSAADVDQAMRELEAWENDTQTED